MYDVGYAIHWKFLVDATSKVTNFMLEFQKITM